MTNHCATRGLAAFFAAFVLLSGATYSGNANSQSADDIREGKVCANCHADAPIVWAGKHGTKGDGRTPIANAGCATCHGDPTEHLKSFTNPMPRRFSKMGADERNRVCLTCHQGGKRIHWQGSMHATRDTTCVTCHQVHAAQDKVRDKVTQVDVCLTCHKEQRAQINRPSRHPIREAKVVCSDCHNPHGTVGPAMMVRDTVTDTCYTCHMEKRGPFVRNHPPVQENCAICHNPHGTTNANLLRQRPPYLCQQCHEPTSHRGTIPGNISGSGTGTNRAVILARGCVNCHANIHGSNNPALTNERAFRR